MHGASKDMEQTRYPVLYAGVYCAKNNADANEAGVILLLSPVGSQTK